MDDIPNFLVWGCISVLSAPSTHIFNLILTIGIFPQAWKSANIRLIFKSGEKSNIEYYRSIAVISNFAKVFEIAIVDTLNSQLRKHLINTMGVLKRNLPLPI